MARSFRVIASRPVGAKRRRMTGSAKQSIEPAQKEEWIASSQGLLAMTWRETRFRILAARFTRGLHDVVPLDREGAGNAGCALHPRSRVQGCTKESAHEHTGSAEAVRHSLRNGFTAYAVLSPATNSSCHRRPRIDGWSSPVGSTSPPPNLTPATGVRTTRFCRTQPAPFVLRAVCSLTGDPPCDHACAPTLSRPPHPIPRS